jgi:8-oxo-dGTP pyrophosphatase MutT (NUDIX family)
MSHVEPSPEGPLAEYADRRLLAGPPPWSTLPRDRRRPITLEAVLAALNEAGQWGPAPEAVASIAGDPLGSWRSLLPMGVPTARASAAAVLVALFEEAGEARVVLTRRSEELRTHRGQVSFPGGRMDAGEDPSATALREAYEEIGLDRAGVGVTAWLHPVFTMNAASLILPVVGVLEGRPSVSPNPSEVARVFDVELAELVHDGVYHEADWDPFETWSTDGSQRRPIWFFDVSTERVWGATARILHELVVLSLGLSADNER